MLWATKLEEGSPETFAAAEWHPEGSVRGTIWFAGEPDSSVTKAASGLPFDVEIRTDAPQSRLEFLHALDAVNAELSAAGATETEISSSVGLDSVTITYGSSSFTRTSASVESAIRSIFPDGVKITISTTGAPPELREQVLRGGQTMSNASNGILTCTSGFTAIRGSQWGVLTAGHCPDTTQRLSGSTYNLTYVTQHVGSYGDAQFNASSDPSRSNSIKISSSLTYRTITSSANATVGAAVCNYGRTRSTAACATVQEVNYCNSGKCRLVRTNATFTNDGDSGGPWYYNNTAVGLHTGQLTTSKQAVFTQINQAKAILSAEVWLG